MFPAHVNGGGVKKDTKKRHEEYKRGAFIRFLPDGSAAWRFAVSAPIVPNADEPLDEAGPGHIVRRDTVQLRHHLTIQQYIH